MGLMLPQITFGQQLLNNFRNSLFTAIYKLDSTSTKEIYTARFLNDSSKYFTNFVAEYRNNQEFDLNSLKSGSYLFIKGEENNIRYWIYEKPVFMLKSAGVNNQLQVFIYDLKGNIIKDARLNLIRGGKSEFYHEDCGCYPIKLSEKKRQIIPIEFMVSRGQDFTFGSFSFNQPTYETLPKRSAQNNYGYSFPAYTILPGYLVINQPKFKQLDSLKWKAFLLKPNGKAYKKPLKMMVYNNTRGVKIKEEIVKPSFAGAYDGIFQIADTLAPDNQYTIQLYGRKNRLLKSETFMVENYDLKKNFFDAKINKNYLFAGEPIRFTMSAFDANGLPLMDAKIKITVGISTILDYYIDSLFIPFSWAQKYWEYQTNIDPSGVTEIFFPDSLLFNANIQFSSSIKISTADGDYKEFNLPFSYDPTADRYIITMEKDSVVALFLHNSKISSKKAVIKLYNNTLLSEKEVLLPAKIKVDDYTVSYHLFTDSLFRIAYDLEDRYAESVHFEGERSYDSILIRLINPLDLNIKYKIFHGNDFMQGGSGSQFELKKLQPSDKSFHVIYTYRWKGREYIKEASFDSREKGLQVKIEQPGLIYPGQSVPVSIYVKDYRNRAAKNVNLTPFAINTQMGDIRTPDLPYFGKSKTGILNLFTTFDTKLNINNYKPVSAFYSKMPLLSESPYYQLVFSKTGLGKVYEEIASDNAEFSPYVFKDRQNQIIYAIYLNKSLVYIANTNIRPPYSFKADPGVYTVSLRTANRMITIDNVSLVKGKKLFLCVQDDSLTHIPEASYVSMEAPYLKEEQASIAKHLLYFNTGFIKNSGNWYLVQNNRAVPATSFNHYNMAFDGANYFVAGPFERGAVQLVFPGKDSLEFYFEHGTGYRIFDDSVTTTDLQKLKDQVPSNILSTPASNIFNLTDRAVEWPYRFGKHELVPPPIFSAKVVRKHPGLHDYSNIKSEPPYASLFFKNISNRQIQKIWLFNNAAESYSRIYFSQVQNIQNLTPGLYNIIIQFDNDSICMYQNFTVQPNGTNYKLIRFSDIQATDSLLIAMAEDRIVELNKPKPRVFDNPPVAVTDISSKITKSDKKNLLTGYIFDQNHNPIDLVTIFIEKAGVFVAGATTNQMGYFEVETGNHSNVQLKIFANSKYYVVNQLFLASEKLTEIQLQLPNIAGMAYGWVTNESVIRDVYTNQYTSATSPAYTSYDAVSLAEISVTSGQRIFSLAKANKLFNSISSIAKSSDQMANEPAPQAALIDQKNGNFSKMYEQIKVDSNANRIRSNFRDYAYFIPNIFTNNKGEAHFTITFPDNQTLWKTFVPAMDYHKRTGLGQMETKSFKPVNATLAMPKFLVEGDIIRLCGRVFNYTENKIQLTSTFSLDNQPLQSISTIVASVINDSLDLKVDTAGKYQIKYSFRTIDNYIDGEERTLPVYVNGKEIAKSNNFDSEGDTLFQINPNPENGKTTVTLTNNQVDLLREMIAKLKNYGYGCNEQNASKLKALLAEKSINQALGNPFLEDKLVLKLIKKLEKAQSNDGVWGWWNRDDKAEIWMTCYIIEALSMAAESGYHTRAHIKGAEYLRASIKQFGPTEKLYAIEILSAFYNKLDYEKEILDFDQRKLSLQDKFRLIRLKQITGLPYSLEELMNSKSQVKSGMYWGEEVIDFKTNIIPTSALAYEVLKNDSTDHKMELKAIRKYFLNHMDQAKNTIEQAVLLQKIAGDIVKDNRITEEIKPQLLINNQVYNAKEYPCIIKLDNAVTTTIEKKGAPLYISIFRSFIDKKPAVVDSIFKVDAWLEQLGKNTDALKKSVPVVYQIKIEVKKTSDYVMIEIPIPSSCYYGDKTFGKFPNEVYREYYDDKVVVFCRSLPKGVYNLGVSLEPRFTGSSTLLPVKVQLMYYPDKYGMNLSKRINVQY
jgi:hypothetical protein